MLYPPGVYYVKKTKRYVILSSDLPKLVMDSSKKTKCHVITFHCNYVIPPLTGKDVFKTCMGR